ncbi:ThiF family adenylyltransferase [Sphingobacterium bambusae]|uniref:ThiF family adenylyltransferase n=1 Tax=Sphingobacterium bambusae TaxID=662858 RepID=A0ABW6BLB6_9SPHI|nr:ThiF family adenylyltransferase [Sphingobacterium bambusae]WPL49422.1 ThiF family adenylyltransferase [Sphingobacterium bambusae]
MVKKESNSLIFEYKPWHMTDSRYTRNRIFLKENEQEKIKSTPIFLGGCGIGSVIAECALRFGFENITLADGDAVELTNLNRQNFLEADVSNLKVTALKNRLLSINSDAKINIFPAYLNEENCEEALIGHTIAINALDFSKEFPVKFDELCIANKITILHPYNLGWGGLLTVVGQQSPSLQILNKGCDKFSEITFIEYVLDYYDYWGKSQTWLKNLINEFKNEDVPQSPPQLSIGSWILGSICTHVLYKLATGENVKLFPEFYLSTIQDFDR